MQTAAKTVIVLILSLVLTIVFSNTSHASKIDDACKDVEMIFARGSGADVNNEDLEASRFFTQVRDRIDGQKISYHEYELGTEWYNGYQYPAIAVANGWSYTNGIGAKVGSGHLFTYGDSVDQGVGELQYYLTQRHTKCAASDTLYIIGGYSQGAQVVGQTLPKLNINIRDDIVYVALFGDPKLHYPEGEGWNPSACQGERSVWRKVPIFNCDHDNGSLGARKPYLPDHTQTKTGLWCYDEDMICDPGRFPNNSNHTAYKNNNGAIDHAAQIAVTRLQGRLKQDNPPPPPWDPTPEPPVNYDQALNTQRVFNQGANGENVVFAVDVSESMRYKLPEIEQYMRDTIPKIIARGGKVAAAVYWGVEAHDGKVYTGGSGVPFDDTQRILDNLHNAMQPYGQFPGSPLVVFDASFHQLQWTPGATKSVIAFTNSPLLTPDAQGLTQEQIAAKALAIDPVNIYPVVPEEYKDSYASLAELTSGQVLTYTDDMTSAANQAFDKITKRPVPFLGSTEYKAETGQEITFDASDSYVIDSSITKYDWDYNGDGQFEASTSTPIIKHAYQSPFTGYIQVRVTASNDTLANMSAKVTIGPIAPPVLPPAPSNLTYTITETTDNKSVATLNWQVNPEVHAWLIQLNDMPMGHVEASRTSIEITDINRTNDVTIRVGGATGTNDGLTIGEFSSITIPAIKTTPPPPPPVVSTCNYSNLLVQLFCKAIAVFRVYIQGILYYILPYRL